MLDDIGVAHPGDPVLGQALPCVAGHGLHQLFVNTALRTGQPHSATTHLAQPFGDGFLVFRHFLDHYPGRHHEGCGLVELFYELSQYQFFAVVLGAFHEEMVPAYQLAPPDEEHLDPGLVVSLGHGDNVHVADGVGIDRDPLLFGHFFDGFDAVSQDSGALELEVVRGLLHVGFQVIGHRRSLAVHEHDNLADNLGVVLFAGSAGAWGYAAVDVVL